MCQMLIPSILFIQNFVTFRVKSCKNQPSSGPEAEFQCFAGYTQTGTVLAAVCISLECITICQESTVQEKRKCLHKIVHLPRGNSTLRLKSLNQDTDMDPDQTFFLIADPDRVPMHIRIQFQIQGFDDQKLKKIYSCKTFF